MRATRLAIPDVILLEPRVFADERGYFYESFNGRAFEEATGVSAAFVQDNHSSSKKGVVRGLHLQRSPHDQGKLVRVVRGAVYDVAVDLRPTSPTHGHWVGEILTAENRRQLWIPPGFAHGFASLEDNTEFLYKVTSYWNKAEEVTIKWDDETLAISWPIGSVLVSEKDVASAISFAQFCDS